MKNLVENLLRAFIHIGINPLHLFAIAIMLSIISVILGLRGNKKIAFILSILSGLSAGFGLLYVLYYSSPYSALSALFLSLSAVFIVIVVLNVLIIVFAEVKLYLEWVDKQKDVEDRRGYFWWTFFVACLVSLGTNSVALGIAAFLIIRKAIPYKPPNYIRPIAIRKRITY